MKIGKLFFFLDNFSGHSPNKNKEPFKLTNIELQYFIANTTSACQPMDQGIIKNAKVHYRRRVIDRKLDSIEYDYEYQEIDVKTAIEYFAAVWKEVSTTTIRNCFKKAGFKQTSSQGIIEAIDNDESIKALEKYCSSCSKLKEREDFDSNEYLDIDTNLNSLETYSTDEDLIKSIQCPKDDNKEEDKDEIQPVNEEIKKVTRSEANQAFELLKQYFYQNSDDSILVKIQENLQVLCASHQSKIGNFFKI